MPDCLYLLPVSTDIGSGKEGSELVQRTILVMGGQHQGVEVNVGLAAASLLSIVVGAAGVVWYRRGRSAAKGKEKKGEVKEVKEEELKEIQQVLQESLTGSIGTRLEATKTEMRVKRLDMERRVGEVRKGEEAELKELEEKHRKEKEEVKSR